MKARSFIDRRETWRETLHKAKPENVVRLAKWLGLVGPYYDSSDLPDLIAAVASRIA